MPSAVAYLTVTVCAEVWLRETVKTALAVPEFPSTLATLPALTTGPESSFTIVPVPLRLAA